MTDHLRLLYKINDPAVIHLLCLNRQIIFVINKPDIYFTSIAYWLIFLGFFVNFWISLNILYLDSSKCRKILKTGRNFKRHGSKLFPFHPFPKIGKKKHPLNYELPSIPPKKVESNDSVNSYLVPYWNKNLTCR